MGSTLRNATLPARAATLVAFFAVVSLAACSASDGAAEAPGTAGSTVPRAAPRNYDEGKEVVATLVDTSTFAEITTIIEGWVVNAEDNTTDCHGLLRHAGAEFAKKKGLVEVPSVVCDYGAVHGMLYGYAEVINDIDEYVRAAVPFCEKVADVPGRPSHTIVVRRDKCVHGIGHGLALLAAADIKKGLDACDTISAGGQYHQCTGALIMEYGEDRLAALGWSMSHSDENSPTVLVVDESRVPTLCDGRTPTCHERFWMFVLPSRATFSGTGDGDLARDTCARFSWEYERRQCLTGFGNLAGALWTIFDFQDGVSYPPSSPEEADIAAQRAVDRCARHPDLGVCLLGFIPSQTPRLYYINHPHIPDFCRFVPKAHVEECEFAVNVAKNI